MRCDADAMRTRLDYSEETAIKHGNMWVFASLFSFLSQMSPLLLCSLLFSFFIMYGYLFTNIQTIILFLDSEVPVWELDAVFGERVYARLHICMCEDLLTIFDPSFQGRDEQNRSEETDSLTMKSRYD
jgi:hypothetical protein